MHDGLRLRLVIAYTAAIWRVIGVVVWLPLLTLLFYPAESQWAWSFLVPGGVLLGVGQALWWRLRPPPDHPVLKLQDGRIVVLLIWLTAILVGMVPFIVIVELTPAQALFEATSGWTTTGLSVIDVTEAPHILLVFRSLTQYVGGLGFVMLGISALLPLAPDAPLLPSAAGKDQHYFETAREAATIFLRLYLGYLLIGVIGFRLAGMDWFDAVNHALTGVSTGGFSTQAGSIGHWDAPLVEGVAVILMLLGAMNFTTIYLLVRRDLKRFSRMDEVRFTAVALPLMIGVVLLVTTFGLYGSLGRDLRAAIFEVTSALSGTGFTTVQYPTWNVAGLVIITGLMMIGGGDRATTGGIKQNRVMIILRGYWRQVRHPDASQTLNIPRGVSRFVWLYLGGTVIGTGVFMMYGYPLTDSFFEFGTTLGTVGLTTGITGSELPASLLLFQSLAMLLGRLEFYVVLVGVGRLIYDVARTDREELADGFD